MLISSIPNVTWQYYHRSLVSKILDNKALYVCISYMQMFHIAFLSNAIANLEILFKVEYAKKKAIGEHQAFFPLNFT